LIASKIVFFEFTLSKKKLLMIVELEVKMKKCIPL
jgi:hypothetical protein